MRFAVLHCPNPDCRLKVWVPVNRLGHRGRCPQCGHIMKAPQFVPPDELTEGPAIMQVIDENDRAMAGCV